ncbi:type II and III secretion system protein family protein [Paraburkholderia silviterrae]|uniref:Type II and III secretion system protein family protein n=1 Tax=Paraburkholderia silviterrae TaxID=2528715 RepID=A0A4R5LY34_9BURK|nr:type II and III secretion system protein family protein [Paraburkholderia silviterrae]TDG17241.1 type II and III secretion system protein family protein [Paraburkholderia silviterrae]
MDTKVKVGSVGAFEDIRPWRVATLAWVCAGLMSATPGWTQEPAGNGAPEKSAAAAPVTMGKGPMQMTISMGPAQGSNAAPKPLAGPLRGPNCVGAIRNESNVVVPLGKSTLVPLDEPVRNRTIGNPEIAQATMVSPQTLYLVGQSVGTTNMIVQGKSGACQVIDVIVSADAGGLQAALVQLMPQEHAIRVSTAADNLVLAGHVSSAQAAQQAVEIAKVFGVSSGSKSGGVINMLSVDSPQQVMLEVKVAEVDKTLIDQLGSAVNIQGGFGSWTGALVSNLLAGVSSAFAVSKANNRPFNLAVDAQKTDNLVKILAEPNLVTISGQEATFLAGGKIFIPVPQSGGGTSATAITLQEEEFGVGLKFTPTVLSGGRINLKVAPEVSELSPTGVTLSASNVSGVSILPLITTRRASTTVQMADGESFAIGGLINNNITGSLKAVPGLGEIPVLGALMRSTSFQQDRSELIFVVTAHLVKPVQNIAQLQLPTDSFSQPLEADVYATGNMEGRAKRNEGRFAPAAPAPVAPAGAQATPAAPAAPASAPAVPAALPAPQVSSRREPSAPSGPAPDEVVAQPVATQQVSVQSLEPPAGDDSAARAQRVEHEAARIASNQSADH